MRQTIWLVSTLFALIGGGMVALPTRATPLADETPSAASSSIFLPLVSSAPLPANPFGFNLGRRWTSELIPYADAAQPSFSRAGDLLWGKIEEQRGTYNWDDPSIQLLEANIRALRAAGIEPMVIIQWTPPWAQSIPDTLCSPPRPEHYADFARFAAAAAARYSTGDLQVRYWEIWNEPDFNKDQVRPLDGTGCWANKTAPYYGGDAYGRAISVVGPAIKRASPDATVVAGAFAHFWPDDTVTTGFLRGMIAAGALPAFDTLSFHAYGEYGAGDRLIFKSNSLRRVLAEAGAPKKPLMATEIASTCYDDGSCPPNFLQHQANYAARIYAEALALHLQGAMWYTLADSGVGFLRSHLIDVKDGTLTPRPAYHSFVNSSRLLQGAHYDGPPIVEPPPDQAGVVQVLVFRKPQSTLYVVWVPKTSFPVRYDLPVPIGAAAICTDQLNTPGGQSYDCSDANRDGFVPRAVNELPQYIEVLP